MDGAPALVAHQRESARQNAAIGERRQQCSGMRDAGVMVLHQGRERAAGTLGQPDGAFAVARDGMALRRGVGKFGGF